VLNHFERNAERIEIACQCPAKAMPPMPLPFQLRCYDATRQVVQMQGRPTALAGENITVAVVQRGVPMLLQNATKQRYDRHWILTALLGFCGAHVRAPHAARYAELFARE